MWITRSQLAAVVNFQDTRLKTLHKESKRYLQRNARRIFSYRADCFMVSLRHGTGVSRVQSIISR